MPPLESARAKSGTSARAPRRSGSRAAAIYPRSPQQPRLLLVPLALLHGLALVVVLFAARQSLADSNRFRKTLLGRGDEVRVYEFTNCGEGLDQKHKKVTFKLWDRVDLNEPGVKRTDDGKRRTVPSAWKGAPPAAS